MPQDDGFDYDSTASADGSPTGGRSRESMNHRDRRRSNRMSFQSVRSSIKSVRSGVGSVASLHTHALEHFGGKDLLDDEGLPILASYSEASVRKTSDMQTFMTLIKAFVGPAHLYLAKGLANAGVWVGLVSLFLCSALNAYCISLLIECKEKVNISAYSQMGMNHIIF